MSAIVELEEHGLVVGSACLDVDLDAMSALEEVLAHEDEIAAIRMLAVLRARHAKRRRMRVLAVDMGPRVAIARPASREGLLDLIVGGILRRKVEVAGENGRCRLRRRIERAVLRRRKSRIG